MYISKLIKKQTTIAVITIIMLSIIALGSSYALFQDTFIDEDNTQTLNVADLTVAFSNGSGTALTDANAINITMQPMTDAAATAASYLDNLYTFAVSNSGDLSYTYTIKVVDNPAYLEGGANYDSTKTILPFDYIRYKLNDHDIKFLNTIESNNNIIYKYTINPGETHTYTLRLWVADSDTYDVPNSVIGAERHLNILIEGEASEFRAPDGWHTAKEGTLLYGIKKNQNRAYNANYNPNNITLTVPGRASATTNEGLRGTTDDYGASYYYRGAVANNYVVFANMCWRIVRVTGDGSIKLALYNYNANSVDNPCSESEDGSSKAFARSNNEQEGSYLSAFNVGRNNNTYIGYMYSSTPNASTFEGVHANDVDSTILSFLKSWYDIHLRTSNNSLADTIWCNDNSLVEDMTYNPMNYGSYTNTGLGNETSYYMGMKRTNTAGGNSPNPSLKCPGLGSDGKLSKFTARDAINGNAKLYSNNKEYKIGLLTADEVAFAGARHVQANANYYLSKNASSNLWWTLTPVTNGHVTAMLTSGGFSYYTAYSSYAVRPAIALKPNVKYTLLDESAAGGTASNPFIIS